MKKNNGFTLLEVLISMLLLMVIGLGSAYLLARANVTQRDMNIHLLTVSKMRYILQNGGCTSSSSISINGTNALTPCTSSSATYTVSANGLSASDVAVTSPSISVSSTDSTTTSLIPSPITISP
ncbi:hypothetical protein P255_01605 [Acinetobacter brisouii CIP 110357]|uniref:Prepilin-type N-terminal cleavage/methylation domain-containing protein n=1 Tax=Acinetobacter brisouii CIP 110357 TaxID=1341683 RepID=V2VTL7_9GAMM|nr:prepilin-type N-terminal cleavage/methylation domain-containing protein [Acinetobacter brisouii]ENV47927.1 hypothetical protein F954_00990 [Acinetobacter brisouii ANC 4119]ESK51099.1 hypothetical protein P255_01605 [Acinetobacter brisouii CIP 110357]